MPFLRFILLSIILSIASFLQAKEKENLNYLLLGFGTSNIHDSYLSPLNYTGWNINFINKQSKLTSWFDGKFFRQQNIDLIFSRTQSPAKNTLDYYLKLRYDIGGHYLLYDSPKFSIRAGALTSVNVGVIYNNRNGNNPATARGYITLLPSTVFVYNASSSISMRLQANMAILGIYFQPEYGQSYYELSLGSTKGIINLSQLGNFRDYQLLYTVDIPIRKRSIILGASCDWLQSRIYSVNRHNYNYNFIVGIPL